MKTSKSICVVTVFILAVAVFAQVPPIPRSQLNLSPSYSALDGYTNDKSLLARESKGSARAAAYDAASTAIKLRLLNAAKKVEDLKAQLTALQSAHDAAIAELNALQESLRALEQQMREESRSLSK